MDGLHLTADLRGVDPALPLMSDVAALAAQCRVAVQRSGLTAVAELLHRFAPTVSPAPSTPTTPAAAAQAGPALAQSGITGVLLLAESHLAVHTWPELGAVTLDVYVCNYGQDNRARAQSLMAALIEAFAPHSVRQQALQRG